MPLKITNSLTGKKEEFCPLEAGTVKMYVCGPTVYDEPHIGHLRSAYVFEVVRNYFKYSGTQVRFARNVTDVDDKIIQKARSSQPADLNAAVAEIAGKYFKLYKNDLTRLGIREPDFEPKATEHIPQMIELIGVLIEKKHAYAAGGDVYFDVKSFPDYGEISHQRADQMLEEARLEPNPHKRNPLDFVLWKQVKDDEPFWDSPWGKGRPGWHIECSAMSLAYFKDTFDIHGGGRDLLFPHHENENAQSRCGTGRLFAKVWVHHGLVTVEGKKMSKSLKNFVTLDEVIKEDPLFGDEVLKLTFLGTHYGAAVDYTRDRIKMDRQVWRRFLEFFENARLTEKNGAHPSQKRLPEFNQSFREAMDNDFNTPEVLARMHALMRETYKSGDHVAQVTVAAAIRNFGFEIFGIVFDQNANAGALKPEIEKTIAERAEARSKKDFKKADEIRERLLRERNIELRDLADGRTTWRCRL